MNCAAGIFHLLLLAEVDRLQSMGKRFRGRSAEFHFDDFLTGMLLIGALGLGVFILARLRSSQEKWRASNHPWALFRELCKAHQLDRSSCRLLRELARWQALDHPARLFLEPERYELRALSPQLVEQAEALHALRDRLIGPLASNTESTRAEAVSADNKAGVVSAAGKHV